MRPDVNSIEYKNAISVEQMREYDRYTIENYVPGDVLMYRAALGVYEALYKRMSLTGKKIAIVCGSGNNGGDGYALAGKLADRGFLVGIYRVSDKFSDDGLYYFNMAEEKGAFDVEFTENTTFTHCDVIVDCILGTGLKGEPRGLAALAIERINQSGAYVVSVDINSGLDGDTGIGKIAVKSDLTVSIGFYKKGMFLNDAPSLIGDLVNVDIGIVVP